MDGTAGSRCRPPYRSKRPSSANGMTADLLLGSTLCLDICLLDVWGIMEYSPRHDGENIKIDGYDRESERIAMTGQEWADEVLRRENMQICMLMLLLEYT